jgi:peptidoglycan/LPS O-acetylase OafA/YrhL
VLNFVILKVSPKTSFYLLPTRLWEFLLGFITAYWLSKNKAHNKKFKSLNLVLIFSYFGISILPINFDSGSPIWGHPGIIAFGVTAITASYLYFGLPEKW